jgi:alkanesulfonate monooxygenase SsuD/methylene tetrahydromethanopterin reductase-like flavin-dependent oxidoreductase (luciferase family)
VLRHAGQYAGKWFCLCWPGPVRRQQITVDCHSAAPSQSVDAMLCWLCVAAAPLQEASALEQNVKGKVVSAEAKRAQAVASIRREEAVLAQQASELAGQVRNRTMLVPHAVVGFANRIQHVPHGCHSVVVCADMHWMCYRICCCTLLPTDPRCM